MGVLQWPEDLALLPSLPLQPLCPRLLTLAGHPLCPSHQPRAVWTHSRPLHLTSSCLDLFSTAVYMARSSHPSSLCLNVPCSEKPFLLKTAAPRHSPPCSLFLHGMPHHLMPYIFYLFLCFTAPPPHRNVSSIKTDVSPSSGPRKVPDASECSVFMC